MRLSCSNNVLWTCGLGHGPYKHGLQVMDSGSILSGCSMSQSLDYSVPWSCLRRKKWQKLARGSLVVAESIFTKFCVLYLTGNKQQCICLLLWLPRIGGLSGERWNGFVGLYLIDETLAYLGLFWVKCLLSKHEVLSLILNIS